MPIDEDLQKAADNTKLPQGNNPVQNVKSNKYSALDKIIAIVLAAAMLIPTIYVVYESRTVSGSETSSAVSSVSTVADSYSEPGITDDDLKNAAAYYMQNNDYETASRYLTQLIAVGDVDSYKQRAQCWYQTGKYEEMFNDCKSFLDKGGIDSDGTVNLMESMWYMQQEEYKEAEDSLNASLTAGYSDTQTIYQQLIRCNIVLEEYDKVIENTDKALGDDTATNAEMKYYRGISYIKNSKYTEAETDLEYVEANTTDDNIKKATEDLLSQLKSVSEADSSEESAS
jgi:tetratricopeptide (TPR) repeat protein